MSVSTVPARPTTLGEAIVPRLAPAWRAVVLVSAGVVLTAIAAQIQFTIPGNPVPFTGQTAAVLLTGAALGSRLGSASMLLYVALGAIGLPIYADGAWGIERVFGITGGYLIGFIVAAALVGWLAQRGWDRTVPQAAMLMVLGNLVIYLIGVPVLAASFPMPLTDAVDAGALAFIPGDALKIALAAGLLPLAWRLVGSRQAR